MRELTEIVCLVEVGSGRSSHAQQFTGEVRPAAASPSAAEAGSAVAARCCVMVEMCRCRRCTAAVTVVGSMVALYARRRRAVGARGLRSRVGW